jgi:hypothetical protein
VHITPLVEGDLRDDMSGGTETINAHPLAATGHPVCTVPDEAGTQERRGMLIVVRDR